LSHLLLSRSILSPQLLTFIPQKQLLACGGSKCQQPKIAEAGGERERVGFACEVNK